MRPLNTKILYPNTSVTFTLYGGRTVAAELQNQVIPAVAVEILRWRRYGESLCFTDRRGGRRIIARGVITFFISTFAVEI